MSALGHFQPLSLSPGERPVSGVFRPLMALKSSVGELSVCFHPKRSLEWPESEGCEGLVSANSGLQDIPQSKATSLEGLYEFVHIISLVEELVQVLFHRFDVILNEAGHLTNDTKNIVPSFRNSAGCIL